MFKFLKRQNRMESASVLCVLLLAMIAGITAQAYRHEQRIARIQYEHACQVEAERDKARQWINGITADIREWVHTAERLTASEDCDAIARILMAHDLAVIVDDQTAIEHLRAVYEHRFAISQER